MDRFRSSLDRLRRDSRKGVSLAVVICISALLMALSLALVYSAGSMLAQSNRKLQQERCYQLARSFAGVLDAELKKYERKEDADLESFYLYANKFLEGIYGEYDPDNPDATIYHYTASATDGQSVPESYGTIRVRLMKEQNQTQDDVLSGTIPPQSAGSNYQSEVEKIMATTFQPYTFTVEVIAGDGELSYKYSTEYYRQETYRPEFYSGDGGTVLVWDTADGIWRIGNEAGSRYNLANGEEIGYRYDTTRIQSCKFVSVHQEGGGPG